MKIYTIIEDVALLAGSYPSEWVSEDSPGAASFRRRVLLDLEHCAAEAVMKCRRDMLTGWRALPSGQLAALPDGSRLLPLPPDYLFLYGIRMTDWEREVRVVLPADHWLAVMQDRGCDALRGSPSRPLVFEGITPEGNRALRICGSGGDASLATGWYMPAPTPDETGEIGIPPAAYRETLRMIVERMGSD
ncbi:MAG: hypothetical protein K2O49_06325 [Muribaculaceae bacterium]|nr:hypothetical protein [Muribaculaceae bacterium]